MPSDTKRDKGHALCGNISCSCMVHEALNWAIERAEERADSISSISDAERAARRLRERAEIFRRLCDRAEWRAPMTDRETGRRYSTVGDIYCPVCGAGPEEPCEGLAGFHAGRLRAVKALGQMEELEGALEDLVYYAQSLADSMASNEREKLLEALDRARQALQEEDDRE